MYVPRGCFLSLRILFPPIFSRLNATLKYYQKTEGESFELSSSIKFIGRFHRNPMLSLSRGQEERYEEERNENRRHVDLAVKSGIIVLDE